MSRATFRSRRPPLAFVMMWVILAARAVAEQLSLRADRSATVRYHSPEARLGTHECPSLVPTDRRGTCHEAECQCSIRHHELE